MPAAMSPQYRVSRRELLRSGATVVGAAVACTLVSACGSVAESGVMPSAARISTAPVTRRSGQPLVARIATDFAESSPQTDGLRAFAAQIAERTAGEIRLTVHPAQQLGTAEQLMAGFRLGNLGVLVSPTTGSVYSGMTPYDLTALPYLFDDDEHVERVVYGPIGQDWADRHHLANGVSVFGCVVLPPRQCAFIGGDVRRPEDVHGLRLRAPRGAVLSEAWRWFGALQIHVADGVAPLAMRELVDGIEAAPEELVGDVRAAFDHLVLTSYARQLAWGQASDALWLALTPELRSLWVAAWREMTSRLPRSPERLRELEAAWLAGGGRVVRPDENAWKRASAELGPRLTPGVWGPSVYEQVRKA
jgi:TRAP-type transport system periplasmic protein